MNQDLWIYRYELTSAHALNQVSAKTIHHGALVRSGSGYGSIHPWPELGDEPLDEQLKSLVEGSPTRLAGIALDCAEQDGAARESGISLFAENDAPIPESHWLFQSGDDVTKIRENGFSSVKLKIGPENPELETVELAAEEALRIRVDANATFGFGSFQSWWKSLSETAREQIEFVEDPIPWNWWNWYCLEQSGVPLAVDRDVEKERPYAPWAIFKPAANREDQVLPWAREKGLQIAVTSYMDHPLGQMWAALAAQRLNVGEPDWLGDCGLLTHRCFAKNEFTERIEVAGSVLQATDGTGLGFDELLESLEWKRLI
ncbi:MAG: enolase C-terminal domain-like protein [Verrucomicrobiales bacterium]|nr:enolase C-terminal domain-like protein [Verrucomicrobiales bacterium]